MRKNLLIAFPLVAVLLALSVSVTAQEVIEPETGSIDTIKNLRRVYVICDDEDQRNTITRMLRGGRVGLVVVASPKDAEFYLELKDLVRDVAATRAGGAMHQKSQMRAFIVRPEDKGRVVAWVETETYDRSGRYDFAGAPNEINLTHHFVNALQVARGEKKASIRDLYNRGKKAEKELKEQN